MPISDNKKRLAALAANWQAEADGFQSSAIRERTASNEAFEKIP